jgi:hypothetical protein
MAILETLALQGFRSCPPGEMSAKGRPRRFHRGPANASYRRVVVFAARSGEGPFTKPTTAARPWPREPLFMCPFRSLPEAGSKVSGGWIPALGIRGFHRPLSDPSTDLQVHCHGSERDGRDVPMSGHWLTRDQTAGFDQPVWKPSHCTRMKNIWKVMVRLTNHDCEISSTSDQILRAGGV